MGSLAVAVAIAGGTETKVESRRIVTGARL